MPRTADVKLSSVEVAALGRKASTCMTIDSALLAPAPCVSAAGVNSGSKFRKGKPADDVPTLSSLKDAVSMPTSGTVAQYALFIENHYGGASPLQQLLSKQQASSVVHAAADAAVDQAVALEIEKRVVCLCWLQASSEKRAPLLSGRMAARHAAEVPGLTGLPPASAAQLGLTPLPRSGGMPREVVASAQDASSAARILEVVGQLAELEQERQAQAMQRALWDQRKQAHLAALAAQNASSSSFKTTSREQAARTGSRFIAPGIDVPGPGKYDVRYGTRQPRAPAPIILPPDQRSAITGLHEQRAAKMISDTTSAKEGAAIDVSTSPDKLRTGRSSRAASMGQGEGTTMANGSGAEASSEQPRAISRTQSRASLGLLQGAVGSSSMRPNLFKDAHYVHARPQTSPAGTSSFLAPERRAPSCETAGSHLALFYHHEQIDALPKKAAHLVMPFKEQQPRRNLVTPANTPPALGPGVYLNVANMPATWTGLHVNAGHTGVKRAPDFQRSCARPGSAPPVRPSLPSVPPVSVAEAATALHNLFDSSLNPSDLLGVQRLHALSGLQAGYQPRAMATSRPTSARAKPHSRPASAARTASQAPTSVLAGNAEPVEAGSRVSYIGMHEVDKFSSAGFAHRVKGGAMSQATRAQDVRSARTVLSPKVTPPASAPLHVVRPGQVVDKLDHDPADFLSQGHRPRSPSWQLPPNRAALSKQWVSAAALAYL
ncbi:hypothetical protein QJQ45_021831 [Haematococcus lacustris]|nr:hypothetical protein QJQ45_021831 [Haematococcus lacustris]